MASEKLTGFSEVPKRGDVYRCTQCGSTVAVVVGCDCSQSESVQKGADPAECVEYICCDLTMEKVP